MTNDAQLDRVERLLINCLKTRTPKIGKSAEHHISAKKLGVYVIALQERNRAKDALEARPSDPETRQTLCKAQESLDRARSDLKH